MTTAVSNERKQENLTDGCVARVACVLRVAYGKAIHSIPVLPLHFFHVESDANTGHTGTAEMHQPSLHGAPLPS